MNVQNMNIDELFPSEQSFSSQRIGLVQRAVHAAMDATYGSAQLSDQDINQLVGDLVKEKLISAEQSYPFRDRLLDRKAFSRYVGHRAKEFARP